MSNLKINYFNSRFHLYFYALKRDVFMQTDFADVNAKRVALSIPLHSLRHTKATSAISMTGFPSDGFISCLHKLELYPDAKSDSDKAFDNTE